MVVLNPKPAPWRRLQVLQQEDPVALKGRRGFKP